MIIYYYRIILNIIFYSYINENEKIKKNHEEFIKNSQQKYKIKKSASIDNPIPSNKYINHLPYLSNNTTPKIRLSSRRSHSSHSIINTPHLYIY